MTFAEYCQQVRDKFQEEIYKENRATELLKKFEELTNVRRDYFIYGIALGISLILVTYNQAPVVCNFLSMVYPIYATLRIMESTADTLSRDHLLSYWLFYGVISFADLSCKDILLYFPIYYFLKLIFLIWLQLPWTNGNEIFYQRVILKIIKLIPKQDTIVAVKKSMSVRSNDQIAVGPSQSVVDEQPFFGLDPVKKE